MASGPRTTMPAGATSTHHPPWAPSQRLPTFGSPGRAVGLGRPVLPRLLTQLQEASADLLLDTSCTQPLGLRPFGAPAVQL